jgi:outer membrane protein OmpA-like peptidoglycan-associated protein
MISKPIVCAAAFGGVLWCASALAQDNSNAATAPAAGGNVIHLHMPVHHSARHRTPPKSADTPTIDAIGADTAPAPSAAPASLETQSPPSTPAAAAPVTPAKSSHKPEQQSAPAIPFSFGGESESAAPPPPPQTNRAPQASARPETKTASLPPKPAVPKKVSEPIRTKDDEHAGLSKRGAVLFDKGLISPSPAQFRGVKLLANDIASVLDAGTSRVQLEAYGGAPGDKSSDARRLSLKRALAVRQLLIYNGVPSNRIDVRAMGGVDDNGPNDRVDVFVRTG